MSGLIVPHKGLVSRVDPTAFIAANATWWAISRSPPSGLSKTYRPDVEERQAAE